MSPKISSMTKHYLEFVREDPPDRKTPIIQIKSKKNAYRYPETVTPQL